MSDAVDACLAADLARPSAPEVTGFAAHLAAGRPGVAGILFYGSALWTGQLDGILDFYLLVDRLTDWHGPGVAALCNRLLPPNVEFHEWQAGERRLRAKVAILTLGQFTRATGTRALDTTIWARFCQPVGLAYGRDEAARKAIVAALHRAVLSAGFWAAIHGPEDGPPRAYWEALFARTYAAELRVDHATGRADRASRAHQIVAAAEPRYAALLWPAWAELGLVGPVPEPHLQPEIGRRRRWLARAGWRLRHGLAKPLNVARLIKAAFTFTGGADYLAWKIARHTGIAVTLTPWQRRHPILAAPGLLWRLWRLGVFR